MTVPKLMSSAVSAEIRKREETKHKVPYAKGYSYRANKWDCEMEW